MIFEIEFAAILARLDPAQCGIKEGAKFNIN